MARKGIYPDSVKPGIPKLGQKPEGWSEVCFGDVLQIVNRKAELEDDFEYQLVNAKRNRGGIVAREKITGKNILTKTQFYIKEGDFLIANRQIIHGACGVVPKELDGALVSNEYTVLHSKNGMLLNFLKYFTHAIYFQQTCFQSSVGVDVEKMIFKSREWFKYKINLPPLAEQKNIIQILSTWDKAIDHTEQLIEAKIKFKKGLMQQLLTGRKRFKEFLKEKWSGYKIKDIGKVITGNTPSKKEPENYGGTFPWATANDFNSKYICQTEKTLSEKGKKKARIVPSGSVLVTCIASIGKNAIAGIELSTNQQINALVVKGNFNNELIYYTICHAAKKILSYTGKTAVPIINKGSFERIELNIPVNDQEQKKIASILSTCDKEIELLNKNLGALNQQKKGLMQKLLTGKIRVKV